MSVEIRRGTTADLDRLEPLWLALRDHQAVLPEMQPVRSRPTSWEYRRRTYERWLGENGEQSFTLLIAERAGDPVGYAMVSVGESGAATWEIGDRTAEIETLSVLESERGAGVGRALTEAAREVAREGGAGAVFVGVAHTNDGALRFYEREGFAPFYVLLIAA